MKKEELDAVIADYGNKQRLLADQNSRKRKLGEVFEGSEPEGNSSDEADDLEKLMLM